jgi:hypothetical protein
VEEVLRRAAKRDINHKSIGDHLRALGWSVLDLASHGKGVPDYVVGKPGLAVLVECKSDPKISHRKDRELTPDEQRVRDRWQGPYIVVTSGEDAAQQLLQLYRGWQ